MPMSAAPGGDVSLQQLLNMVKTLVIVVFTSVHIAKCTLQAIGGLGLSTQE